MTGMRRAPAPTAAGLLASTCATSWRSSRRRAARPRTRCARRVERAAPAARSTTWPRPPSCPPPGRTRRDDCARSPARRAAILEAVRDARRRDARVRGRLGGDLRRCAGEPAERATRRAGPTTPYAIAKLAAHQLVGALREHDGLHASSGIVFNHESERRPEHFVTRRITPRRGGDRAGPRERADAGLARRRARLVVRRRRHARRLADAPAGAARRLRARERRRRTRSRNSRGRPSPASTSTPSATSRVDDGARARARAHAERRRPGQGQARAGVGAGGLVRGARRADGARRHALAGGGRRRAIALRAVAPH